MIAGRSSTLIRFEKVGRGVLDVNFFLSPLLAPLCFLKPNKRGASTKTVQNYTKVTTIHHQTRDGCTFSSYRLMFIRFEKVEREFLDVNFFLLPLIAPLLPQTELFSVAPYSTVFP